MDIANFEPKNFEQRKKFLDNFLTAKNFGRGACQCPPCHPSGHNATVLCILLPQDKFCSFSY